MAETAFSQFGLDQVIWVPTHDPPHKAAAEMLDFQTRLELVKRAIASHPGFVVSGVEQEQAQPSYAAHTLTALQVQYPNSQWHWILGLDAFRSLPRWYRWQDLSQQCCWLVAPRLSTAHPNTAAFDAGTQVAQIMQQRGVELRWYLLDMPLVRVSSSLIRQYCRDRRSIRYLVPEAVREYIETQQLYHDR